MYTSVGILRYDYVKNYGYKLILEVDQAISDYYFSLIPKWIHRNRQKYHAHVSVVRNEVPVILDKWGKYEGEQVEFYYTHEVFFGEVYCWLNIFCKRLEEVRLELGLPVSSQYTLPPSGFIKCFHMTVANFKGI